MAPKAVPSTTLPLREPSTRKRFIPRQADELVPVAKRLKSISSKNSDNGTHDGEAQGTTESIQDNTDIIDVDDDKSSSDEDDSIERGKDKDDVTKRQNGKNIIHKIFAYSPLFAEKLRRSWTSPIYGFFTPDPIFHEVDGRRCVEFVCGANTCKCKAGRWVRRFLDTKDKASTSNLRRHAKKCWGDDIVEKSLHSDAMAVRKGLVARKDGSLAVAFEAKGKVVVTYSTHLLTKADVR